MRAGQIANYQATLPDLMRERRNQDLGLASGAMNAFGKGTERFSTGDSTTNSSQSSQGGGTQTNSMPDISAIMALTSPNPRVSTNTGASPVATGLGDLGSAVSQYFMAKNKASGNW